MIPVHQWAKSWLPPERLSLSEWSEKYLVLSPEYSARSGPIKLFPFQKAVFDAFTDPSVDEIALMCSTQMLKTLFLQAAISYTIAADPGPILLVEPKEADAKSFSKERLAPMIRDIPALQVVTENKTSKTGQDTVLMKDFPGGSLALAGSIAPGNLARRSIRFLFADEIDKYPPSAGVEGDPISLARERTVTFGSRRKIILCCSPTNEQSRIAIAYEASDQRKPWVPCPKCGMLQILDWSHVEFDKKGTDAERAATAFYQCAHCDAHWDDNMRWDACNNVQWRASKPFNGKAGFWINHLYSPWKTLSAMVEDYLTKKHSNSRQQLQVFYNTTLAQVWKEEGQTPDEELLYARREDYPFGEEAVVPKRALFLTAAVDVQENPPRLEVEVVGWGRNKESWSIDYQVIQAFADDPMHTALPVTSPAVWAELDRRVLQRDYQHESGGTLPIWVMTIDTGSRPKPVYEFALRHVQPAYTPTGGMAVRAYRTVVPVKGMPDDLKIIANVSKEDAARKRQGVRIVGIGTGCAKQELFDNLRHIKPNEEGTPEPNCLHFPRYDRAYFSGLCSEARIVKVNGKIEWQKTPGSRNEPLDLKVYNRAAATICGIDRFKEQHWAAMEQVLNVQSEVVIPSQQPHSAPQPMPMQRPVRRIRGRLA